MLQIPVYAITPNEADASPQLTLNTPLVSQLEKDGEKWFRFDITSPGRFRVKLEATADANTDEIHEGWHFYLFKKGALDSSITDYGKIKTECSTGWYGYAPDTFYVKVVPDYVYGQPVDCPFQVTAIFEQADDWEAEYNNTNLDANPIVCDKLYKGTIMNRDDNDWYSFNITKKGYFNLTFSPDPNDCDTANVGNGWLISAYEADAESQVFSFKTKGIYTTGAFPMSPGKYLLKIQPEYIYNIPYVQVYNLKITETAAGDWESEHNDTQVTANDLAAGATINGNLYKTNDEDWYKLSIPGTGSLNVSLAKGDDVNTNDINNGWYMEVFDSQSADAQLKKSKIKVSDSGSLDVEKGVYYIHVKCDYVYSQPIGCRYTLRADYQAGPNSTSKMKAAKVNWKKAKSKKRKVMLKWKKVSLADGYEVYRSNKKKSGYTLYKNLSGNGSVSLTDTSVSSKKKYYYKIRAYKDINGNRVYSKYSAVKSFKIK